MSRPQVTLSDASTVPTTGVPVVVDWALTETQAGLRSFQLQMRVGDGSWTAASLASATTSLSRRTVPAGTTFRFRVRAIDTAGTVGDWASSQTYRASGVSDASTAIRWSGSWTTAAHTGYLGRRAHSTNGRGDIATIDFDGSSIAWAGPVGPTRGKARVLIDGVSVAIVDLRTATFRARDMVFARNLREGPHTLRVQALGTTGRPTVAIDHFYVLSPQ